MKHRLIAFLFLAACDCFAARAQTNFLEVAGAIPAGAIEFTGTLSSFIDSSGTSEVKFYRVRLLP